MAIKLIRIHATDGDFIKQGEQIYLQRIQRFTNLEVITINHQKKWNKLSPQQVKTEEGEKIISYLQPNDFVILLDEKGKQYSSRQFAKYIDEKMAYGGGNLVFVIGGAYGFSNEVYAKASTKLSLSKMTTSHQLVRLFFLEQLYRAFTILTNHPYHND